MKIFPLSEGAFTVDASKEFIPFNTGSSVLQQRPAGSLLVEIQPFAVITARDIIIFDTGLGYSDKQGVLQIHQHLFDHGINPSAVTKVLISHLHKDHAGGIVNKGVQPNILSFPNAAYYINRNEWEKAFLPGPSYIPGDFMLLKDKKNLLLTDGDTIIDDYISIKVTGGHSPFHQAFWIKENTETIFFGGDVAPQLQQMKNRFTAKYDFDGKKSMELRTNWWKQGHEEKWTFLFYHDLKTPVLTL